MVRRDSHPYRADYAEKASLGPQVEQQGPLFEWKDLCLSKDGMIERKTGFGVDAFSELSEDIKISVDCGSARMNKCICGNTTSGHEMNGQAVCGMCWLLQRNYLEMIKINGRWLNG